MNTYIVNEPSKNIRKVARGFMEGLWKPAIIAVIIITVCTALPTVIFDSMFGTSLESVIGSELVYELGYDSLQFSAVSTLYTLLVDGAFTLGITIFFIELIRNKNADVGNTFAGFGFYFKALGLSVVQGILIGLWTLLLIIPGIVAMYRYSMAFYILADDPEKGIMQCLSESKAMMKGNKWNLCVLNLSFIGWLLLTGIIVAAGEMLIALLVDPGFTYDLIICIVTTVVMCGVTAYLYAAETVFYEMANGNLRPQTDELPPLSQQDIAADQESIESMPPLSQAVIENPASDVSETNEYPELNVNDNTNSVNKENDTEDDGTVDKIEL